MIKNPNKVSQRTANAVACFVNGEGKHVEGYLTHISNTVVRMSNGVIIVNHCGKVIINAEPNDKTGDYIYTLNITSSTAIDRIMALKQVMQWDFDLLWKDGSPHIMIGKVATPIKRGCYTVEQLIAI